jgi:hypothetical protein
LLTRDIVTKERRDEATLFRQRSSAAAHYRPIKTEAMSPVLLNFLGVPVMKRLASAALAGALAIGTVAATGASASADPYYPYHPHHYHGGYDDGGGFVAAGILGLATGLVASQVFSPEPPPPPSPYPYYAAGYGADDAHLQWCEATYRSYDPETDLWRDYQGIPHRCQGPY